MSDEAKKILKNGNTYGMTSSKLNIEPKPLAVDVHFTKDAMQVTLVDGREISVPLVWSSRLSKASAKQRKNWRLIGGGIGIHWEDIDEDLSVESLLAVN